MFAALPTLACGAGDADPFNDGPSISGAGNGTAGAAPIAGTPGSSGSTNVNPTGGSGGGTASGGQAPQAGSASGGVSTGGAGGSTHVEACSFPAWMAGKDYAAGDKVIYMGKAFVAKEANPGYDPLISTYFWDPYSCEPVSMGGGGSGGGGPITNNGECVLDKLLPNGETTYHSMFVPPWAGHQEKPLYNYQALCTALKGFGQFGNTGNAEADKREVAAFFAHVAKETAFLEQTDEAGQPSNAQDYHGRGAIQLTGQANYQAAGDYLQKNLVGSPGLVSTDAVTNWQVALWFWTIHKNPGTQGTQNCHDAMKSSDFAQTTRIINGGIECPGSASAVTRSEYYKTNCGLLSVTPGDKLVC